MPAMNALSSYATTVAGDATAMRVTYHSTVIVEWTDTTITLRTGGWDTVTTRRKMNQAANQFGLNFRVFCKDSETSVVRPDGATVTLRDGMTFAR